MSPPAILDFATMASKWQVEDLVQEVNSMVALLAKRGQGTHMAASLTTQLVKKMEGADLSTSAVLALSDHLMNAGLPEQCKDELLSACDQLAMKTGNGTSAVKLQVQQQGCECLVNYLTMLDWKSLEKEPLWPNVNVLVKRLKQIGVKSVRESLKKTCLGILVLLHLQQNSGVMPKYNQIYQLGQHFSQAFSASTICAKPGVPSLLVYPEKPEMVSPDFVSKAYDADDPPVSKDLPDLNYLVLNHIPVRSTSKLLLQEEATPARTVGSSKSAKSTDADAFKSMADGFVSRMEQAFANLAGANGGGHAALQNQAAKFQENTVVFKPKNTVLALPSTVMEQSTTSVAEPPTQQPYLPCSKPLRYYYMECASFAMSCCFLFS